MPKMPKMPDIKLNFWSKDEDKKPEVKEVEPEPKIPLKNEVQIRIFKRVQEKKKLIFGEGCGNYARFIQIDNLILWSSKLNNLKLEFKK